MYNWKNLAEEYENAREDCLFLISHASYLFKTGGVCWAVDPRLDEDMHAQADPSLRGDLGALRYAFLTHLHPDHYDPRLMETLSGTDCTWILPDFMAEEEKSHALRCAGRCIFVKAGDRLHLEPFDVEVFSSPHTDVFQNQTYGVPEYGYAVAMHDRRLLFPGDVRQYGAKAMIDFPGADVFAHVWLGRSAALDYAPDMVEKFCRHYLAMRPSRLFLGHLYDRTREISDMWTLEHAEAVIKRLRALSPEIPVLIPRQGEKTPL